MALQTAFSVGYLVDQLLRTLVRERPTVARTLRPALGTAALVALPGFFTGSETLPTIVGWWFRHHDGQAKESPPLHVKRGWRALPAEEAMTARRESEPQGKRATWIPLFVDADERLICWSGEERLHYLDGGKTQLPTLDALLIELLEELGWCPPEEPASPTASLGSLLEELDVLVREGARDARRTLAQRPGATARSLSRLAQELELDTLPVDLGLWFAWHDGEELDRLHETFSIFGTALTRMLSIDEALADRTLLLDDDEHEEPWDEAWLPIVRAPSGKRWVYVLEGEGAGSVLFVRRPGAAAVPTWPTLAGQAHACVEARRRSLERPENVVPTTYTITAPQRWVLAVGGILTEINQERFDLLGSTRRGIGAVDAHESLAWWWDVVDGEDACEAAERLLVEHEARFAEDTPTSDEAEVEDSVAYDLGRVPFVVGKAYVATLLDAERAWSYCVRAARVTQRAYRSWSAFGSAYAAFRNVDALEEPETPDTPQLERYVRTREDATRAVGRLLAPGGGWDGLPWDMDLGSPAPPVLGEPRTVRVTTTEELKVAVEAAADGDRILLAPNTYSLPLRLERTCLELVADGGKVIWESRGAESIVMERSGVFASFHGITFRARGPLHDAPATCVHVDDGLLRFVRCRFESTGTGIVLAAEAKAILEECALLCGLDGIEGGDESLLVARGCSIAGADASGISLVGAKARLRGGSIERVGGHCLFLDRSSVLADDLALGGAAFSAVAVLGASELTLRRTTVTGAGESGIMVRAGTTLTLEDVTIRDVQRCGVNLLEPASASLLRCRITGCRENAVLVSRAQGAARFLESHFEDTALTVVCVMGSAEHAVTFSGCTIGSSRECDGLYAENSAVHLVDCRVAASPRVGISIQGGLAHLRGCTINGSPYGVSCTEGATVLLRGTSSFDATDTAFAAVGKSTLRMVECTAQRAELGLWLDGGSLGQALDVTLEACGLGALVSESKLTAVGCRIHASRGRGALFQKGSSVVWSGGSVVDTAIPGLVFLRSAAVVADTSFDGSQVAVLTLGAGAHVEVHRARIDTTKLAGFEVGEEATISLFDTRVEKPGEASIFAHDKGRFRAEACELHGIGDVCVEATGGSAGEVFGCTLVAGAKGPTAHDATSSIHVVDAPAPLATLGWSAVRGTRGHEVRATLPSLSRTDDERTWSVAIDAALRLFAPDQRGEVAVVVRGSRLFAAARDATTLARLEALVARLREGPDLLRLTMQRAEADVLSGREPIELTALLRLLGFVDGEALAAFGEGEPMALHGWSVQARGASFEVVALR